MTLILKSGRFFLFLIFLFAVPFLSSAASISLSPSSGPQSVGGIFTVNILLDTIGAQTDGVDINSLNFNPALLEVQDDDLATAGVQITAGTLMSTTLLNSVNNSTGKIQFSQIPSFGTQFTGSGILGAVHFLVKASGTAAVNFDFTSGSTSDTNVAFGGSDILTGVTNGSYVLTTPPPPPISSSVTLLSPNGGQCFSQGQNTVITWSRTNVDHNALYLTTDGGATVPVFGNWFFMFDSGSAATSSNWVVPNIVTNQARIWVEGHDANHAQRLAIDSSDANFSIQAVCQSPDTAPPAAVANLTVATTTGTSAVFNWTAPGDDGSTGTASSYDIRYSTSTITEANWMNAVQVAGEPVPQAGGTSQSYTLVGLTASTTYFVAIKTADEVPNISILSNVISFRTSAPTSPPPPSTTASVTLLSPNGGQCFSHNSQMPITWLRTNIDHTALYYTIDGGVTVPAYGLWFQMYDSGSNATSYNWTIPSTINSDGVRIWVEGHDVNHTQRLAIDSSDANISIHASCAPPASGGGGGGGGGGSTYAPPVSSGGGGQISSIDSTPPTKVQNLFAVPGVRQIKLSWLNPKSDPDWVRTVVVRKIGSAPVGVLDGVKIYEGTEETFTDLNLEAGKEFFYALFTLDRVPNYSERVFISVTPLAAQLSSGAVVKPETIFNQNLFLGSNNEEVKELQKLLNKLGFIVVQSGPGSPGQESTYFGALTKQAVIKLQNQYRSEVLTPFGLAEGTGYVGTATRVKLNALIGKGGSAISSIAQTLPLPSAILEKQVSSFTKNLFQGISNSEVKNLQILLNQLGFQVAQSGPGSPGQESTYFGALTKQAVIKFQNQYGSEVLAPAGLTGGTGYVGTLTRNKLNTFSGKTSSFFKAPLNQISAVLEIVDASSTRNVLTKAVSELQAVDFRELILKKADKKIGVSEFWPPMLGQLKPPLENFFENDFSAFVFIDDKGKWPGYILKLKSSASLADVKNQLAQWEKTANFSNLFIKPQLIISQPFKNGQTGTVSTRYQLYNQNGAALNYGWKDNLLIISTSYAGFLELLTKL